jgi:hypothetical protein
LRGARPGQITGVERDDAKTLHLRLVDEFERCADVRRDSRMLVARRVALQEELTATLANLRRARAARRASPPRDVDIAAM